MLTFSEELLVLLLDDGNGTLMPIRSPDIECALAGAVLMDLTFANRIDTDLERLTVTDRTPTGIEMLDRTLAKIVGREEVMDTRSWIGLLAAQDAAYIREQASIRLIERGILEPRYSSFSWAFRARRVMPARRGGRFLRALGGSRHRKTERALKERIGDVLFSDDIPDPRDIALIGLVDACDLLGDVFPDGNFDRLRPRIEQLRKMDLIARELAGAISDIERNVKRVKRTLSEKRS